MARLTKNLLTRWGSKLDKNNVLTEYPRPQLVRESYQCLNGVWQYAIYDAKEKFGGYQGDIVVPFSPEALLSGVNKIVKPTDLLYYEKKFEIKDGFNKGRILLHFDAVDYFCVVSLNGEKVGENKGGFYAFTLDITDKAKVGENLLSLVVEDPSDTSYIARGKQSSKPGGIWYTPQSGIWQTVWLESVPESYVSSLRITPDIDNGIVMFEMLGDNAPKTGSVSVIDKGKTIADGEIKDGVCTITLNGFELWSPENPYLYDVKIVCGEDNISSYFAMRKFSTIKDKSGKPRLALNNKPYFHKGLLDQGYWSDGMLTPPSDEAMVYDIKTMKEMGFNMLRKHIKIEPLRWYYHCDKLGMLVWQDMVNGGRTYKFSTIGILPFIGIKLNDHKYKRFSRQDKEGRDEYYDNTIRTINHLYNCPCIAMWVPFNEAWGQFDSKKATALVRDMDKTRTIDSTSGWHDQGGGDFISLHIYFRKVKAPKDDRVFLLSEFGGYSHRVEGHYFNMHKIFGYKVFDNVKDLNDNYEKLYLNEIVPNIDKGLSATVYTQVSDVEDEVNGILTYDREVNKFDIARVKAINEMLKIKE